MTMKTQGPRNLAFLLTELPGTASREVRTIASGEGKLAAGTILGKVTAGGKFVASPNAQVAGKEGAESGVAILAYAVDATDADVQAVTIEGPGVEVKDPMLVFHNSVNDAAKRNTKLAQLRAAGIKAR